jgi:hypothetical protein
VLETVLTGEETETLREVEAAYARFLALDVLDISTEVSRSPLITHTN